MQFFTILTFVLISASAVFSTTKKRLDFRNLYKDPLPDTKPSHSGRIINGQEATPGQFPYQAFLQLSNSNEVWYCGGSLITTTAVLTAAHCGTEATNAYVTLGAQNILRFEFSQISVWSSDIVVHSGYDSQQILNDIAIIRLPEAINLTYSIQLAQLPTLDNDTYAGDTGVVSGWGLTNANSTSLSSVLMWTSNPILTNSACSQLIASVATTQICLSGENGRSACNDDSGGPLTVDGVQVGIVSYGVRNCPSGYPTVFTRITDYLDWIQENL